MRIESLKMILELFENGFNINELMQRGFTRQSIWGHINSVEKDLKMKIVDRRKRHARFNKNIEDIIKNIKNIVENYENMTLDNELIGEIITISTTRSISDNLIIPCLGQFAKKYPNFKVRIRQKDDVSDEVLQSYDILFRPLEDTIHHDIKWFVEYKAQLFASENYIAEFGMPKKPENLKEHRIIAYGNSKFSGCNDIINWHVSGRNGTPWQFPHMTVNSTLSMIRAAEHDLGITSAAQIGVDNMSENKEKNKLVKVLPEIESPPFRTHFAVKKDLSPKMREAIDEFEKLFKNLIKKQNIKMKS